MITSYDTEIEQIVQMVFATMLNIDAIRIEEIESPGQMLCASIRILGNAVDDEESSSSSLEPHTSSLASNVTLGLCPATAQAAAAAMFRIPCEDVTDADQQEVAAELANILGGNLKGLFPGSAGLSLPVVNVECEACLEIDAGAAGKAVWFASEVGPFYVRFAAQADEPLAPEHST